MRELLNAAYARQVSDEIRREAEPPINDLILEHRQMREEIKIRRMSESPLERIAREYGSKTA